VKFNVQRFLIFKQASLLLILERYLPHLTSSTLMVEAAGSSETTVHNYQVTSHHIAEAVMFTVAITETLNLLLLLTDSYII
jgi:hypothetical protein